MTVVKRPPLTVPPDYNLRPPRPSDPSSDADSASKAARETLVGPSSELDPEVPTAPDQTEASSSSSAEPTSAQERARATLIGEQRYQKSPPLIEDDGQITATTTESAPSAGQTALLSRTNRVERDLDALDETRSENRVDRVLLRRLLAWQPPAANQKTTGADNASVSKSGEIRQNCPQRAKPGECWLRFEVMYPVISNALRRISAGFVLAASILVSGQEIEAAVFNPETFTLANGMQVVVITNRRAPVVTHHVWYRIGSADSPPGKSGLAHFHEHLMFKATEEMESGRVFAGSCAKWRQR